MKKIFATLLAILCCVSLGLNVFATEVSGNIGLSETPPVNYVTRGSAAPGLAVVWDISEDGDYEFEGSSASWSDTGLYTNYYFTGQSSYTIEVTNNSNNAVTVSFHGWIRTYMTTTVPGNSTKTITFSSDTAEYNVSKSTNWYMHFSAPCDVEGVVS